MTNLALVGADDDVLELLGGGVSGEELVGDDDDDDDVSGDDDDDDEVSGEELVGLLRKARRGALTRAGMKRMAKAVQKKSKMQRRIKLDHKQRALARAGQIPQIHQGINSVGNVLAGTAATILSIPTVAIRVTDFFVDPNIAASFVINSLLTGRLNLFSSGDAVPASLYDPTAGMQRAPLEIRYIPGGSPITLIVTNVGLADSPFRAAFQCIDLQTRVY